MSVIPAQPAEDCEQFPSPIRGAETSDKFVPFHKPYIDKNEERELLDTLRGGWLTTGKKTALFEQRFAEYVQAPHAIGVNSATAALHLCLVANGIGAGDEVITSPITFAATANVIEHVGARPVFVDVEPDTLNLDPARLPEGLSSRTRAIIPVHFAGHPCDMGPICEFCQRHDLVLVHDAAHAIESRYAGRPVCSSGAAACFSFYATKNITTGEGGMITTHSDALAQRLRVLRLHGISVDAWQRYAPGHYRHWEILEPGYKYNMFDLQACLGIHQLARIERMWAARRRTVEAYDRAFTSCAAIQPLKRRPDVRCAYHLYVVRFVTESLRSSRDELLHALQNRGVGIGVHFQPVHLHPFYREKYGYRPGMFPVAEYAGERVVSLPLFPTMTDNDVRHVIRQVLKLVSEHSRSDLPSSC